MRGIKGIYSGIKRLWNLSAWRYEGGRHPFIEGMLLTAVQALRQRKLSGAVWPNCCGLKRVEWLRAASTLPVVAWGRCHLATRTSKALPSWQLGEAQERPGVLQAAPAVQQHKDG